MTNEVYKKREDILKKVIDKVIIPHYPDVKKIWVWSDYYRGVRRYNVNIITNGIPLGTKIDDEIKSLFKMCGLDAKNRYFGSDYVVTYFDYTRRVE